ncbi:flavocytochrome c [Shewanella intestini]|uniref:Flavocytochrome c n=1 Tax=Shewanella intestini TaxID=2017544 RepID=A0ABS5I4G5_9GAMM|nr:MULTISPECIES: flavocytochrome c [Shewanella]MBR9728594.1 flavocytochrome c [Shewanella intestini]MRG37349.1 flavocytochrome c [Shewanella sp. XMDDZSB0408]
MTKQLRDQVSRRRFLKGGATLGISGLAGLSLSTQAQSISAKTTEIKFDEIVDIIVVGSGFAGLSAALQAAEKGASVMVIDKMPVFGGNSAINGGAMAVADSKLQHAKGVKDSVTLMVSDMFKAGRGMNDPQMLKLVCNGTSESQQWLESHGVRWKPFLQHFGGHSVPRVLQTIESSGAGIVRPLLKAAKAKNVALRNQVNLVGFVKNEQGHVIGIEAKEEFHFPRANSGHKRLIGARKGVIMATGGFSRDIPYRQIQQPKLTAELDSTNHAGATADALKQMMLIGANPVHLDQIQLGPWASPDEKGFGTASQFNTIATYPSGIVVDVRTGKRFFNELADRKERADAIMTRRDDDGKPVYPVGFTNAEGAKKAQTLAWGMKYNVIQKAETLDELAKLYGIPADALKQQVTDWNKAVRAGHDAEFGRPMQKALVIEQGPWYAVRMWPKVHYCMGGVRVNTQSQVLDLITDKPIIGLFAAGEATGGIHGASRLGACAVAEGVVTGRNAGSQCASRTSIKLKLA